MFAKIAQLPTAIQQYLLITLNYWFFTLTDGALRMLVILHFHELGYSAIAIAMLFLFYEVFGVITNLVGGWFGAILGLNKTMNIGLWLQVLALLMLAVPEQYLTVTYVMIAQALSGIAKDLNKMSAKSSIKTLVSGSTEESKHRQLFKWVALLTGSKNTLKGCGFFLGGVLLTLVGFQYSVVIMASILAIIACTSMALLSNNLGKAKNKPKFTQMFSKSATLNYFSAARLCLFAARDVWFVVALPVYLANQFLWSHNQVGAFLAGWIIIYGLVQTMAPKLTGKSNQQAPTAMLMSNWAWALTLLTMILLGLLLLLDNAYVVPIGLLFFSVVFAMNSALHSYGIVAIAKQDGVSLDVGFYYMANALGRLLGTVLSGVVFHFYGITACLGFAVLLSALAAILVKKVTL